MEEHSPRQGDCAGSQDVLIEDLRRILFGLLLHRPIGRRDAALRHIAWGAGFATLTAMEDVPERAVMAHMRPESVNRHPGYVRQANLYKQDPVTRLGRQGITMRTRLEEIHTRPLARG